MVGFNAAILQPKTTQKTTASKINYNCLKFNKKNLHRMFISWLFSMVFYQVFDDFLLVDQPKMGKLCENQG